MVLMLTINLEFFLDFSFLLVCSRMTSILARSFEPYTYSMHTHTHCKRMYKTDFRIMEANASSPIPSLCQPCKVVQTGSKLRSARSIIIVSLHYQNIASQKVHLSPLAFTVQETRDSPLFATSPFLLWAQLTLI